MPQPDAFNRSVGAMLSQTDDEGAEHSARISEKYSTVEEFLAIELGIQELLGLVFG